MAQRTLVVYLTANQLLRHRPRRRSTKRPKAPTLDVPIVSVTMETSTQNIVLETLLPRPIIRFTAPIVPVPLYCHRYWVITLATGHVHQEERCPTVFYGGRDPGHRGSHCPTPSGMAKQRRYRRIVPSIPADLGAWGDGARAG